MNYYEIKEIRARTGLLPWNQRKKSFSEGIVILSKYLSSDYPNLQVLDSRTDNSSLYIYYGDVSEVLENGMSEEDAIRLFQLGWDVGDGVSVYDNYFCLIL